MQHILGVTLRDNDAELMDDDTPGKSSYAFMGLQAAINEAQRRLSQNPNIKQISIYRIIQEIPGVQGRFQLAYRVP